MSWGRQKELLLEEVVAGVPHFPPLAFVYDFKDIPFSEGISWSKQS